MCNCFHLWPVFAEKPQPCFTQGSSSYPPGCCQLALEFSRSHPLHSAAGGRVNDEQAGPGTAGIRRGGLCPGLLSVARGGLGKMALLDAFPR